MKNITQHPQSISLAQREARNGHKAAVLWFTGLSGSGKSTIAMALQEKLFQRGCQVVVLDGDNVRHGLNSDLGFVDSDRKENLRRVSEVAKIFAETGVIVLTSFISPYEAERNHARLLLEPLPFFEIFLDVSLELAESRDPKGLYKKARQGEITNMTGLGDVYEAPTNPDLLLDTASLSVEDCVDHLMTMLKDSHIIIAGQ